MTAEPSAQSEEGAIVPQHSKGSLTEPRGHNPFPVVGVGASAGGLEAFTQLLASTPADTGMAFVLVQHLDPHHQSRLAELLSRATRMPVMEATDGLAVRPNCVYVIPPNANMMIAQGALLLTPRGESRSTHLPVDYLFRSLAEEQQGRAVAVVLSGTGADGALGLCEVKAVGGITFAQDEGSAKHAGMPASAAATGCVDFVLTPEGIGRRLAEIGGHPYLAYGPPDEDPQKPDGQAYYRKILGTVKAVMGVDFSLYRETTIRRRIMRRMALFGQQSLSEYAHRLEADRGEVVALYHDLLINVTSFFRDPDLFDVLKTKVFPELVKGRSPTTAFRVWVPGCSTGQEAYSLAIALAEFFDDRPVRPPVQIFATDLSDEKALEKARAGVYPESIESEVSPARLRRFFRKEDHAYRVDKSIRDCCIFARQNVTADPPFSHLDLVSCRNVLIYLASPLQKRVLPTFHYALNVPGYLVLGTAETVGESTDLFELTDRENKIYAKRPAEVRPPYHFPAEHYNSLAAAVGRRVGPASPAPTDFQREADRILLGRYAPPGVLLSENLDIVQFRGRTSAYLESPPGEPTTNVLKMAREGLFLDLRNALDEAKRVGQTVRRPGVRVRADGEVKEVELEVVPVKPPGGKEACFLVLFHAGRPPTDRGPVHAPAPPAAEPADADALAGELERVRLRQELAATKEYLQSLVEQQDAANEELRSANEEILSSNEELQSTNEEVETAKEELQSANEELTTVNEQLQHRNLELSQANNDLSNLLSSTDIPVVMVGADLRIRRFTPPARRVMSLLPSDVGRPIGDIKPAVLVPDMEAVLVRVIETVRAVEHEVRDRDGRWHVLRVSPYRTADRGVEGAVIVLLDIDHRKRAEEALRTADRRKDEFLATLAHELRNPLAPIRNVSEILRLSGEDPSAVAEACEVLRRQVRQLSRIVEDLIDVSRIVEKKIELRTEVVRLRAVVETAVDSCRSLMEMNRHRLTVTLPAEPVYLDADPSRLSQVLMNLLNNAAKYTRPGGEISLTAERTGGDGPGEVVVRVRDDGVGITPDLMPRLFDMFAQGDQAVDGPRSGLGVGLSLVRSLVQMHGGTVDAHSDGVDRGSEFVVRLPAADPDDRDPEAGPDGGPARAGGGDVSPRRVLVVDDSPDQARSLGRLLTLMGHDVRLAADGRTAVDAAVEFVPDVALVDIGLPMLNGYEVARRIRALPHLRHVILIAQTGWGQDEDRRKSREAGFDHHLVKPVDPDVLERIFQAEAPRPRP